MRNSQQTYVFSGLAVLFGIAAFGRTLPFTYGQSSNQGTVQPAVVQGTVFRAGSGQALKRARVNLRRVSANVTPTNLSSSVTVPAPVAQAVLALGNTQAVTDDTGRYVFNGVAP